ncbi:hypothetical protein GGX14DRAFT_560937 [Mycena pura]|uniref:DUF6532 domain-containing protein n=1 Tax=Mycena pura TaxID=153505 RepID=A0AAD6VP02_9AGAR|nr:hypothetical protein GGX14DRAFT_560937 [Mycena pura]
MRIWTIRAFPDAETQERWVQELWGLECGIQKYQLTDAVRIMIKRYGWHGRGVVIAVIKLLIDTAYGFHASEKQTVIDRNLTKVKRLTADAAFIYKDPKEKTGFAQNDIIMTSIVNIWFKNNKTRGSKNPDFFNLLRLPTLALLFTAIEWGIERWATGRFMDGGEFNETKNSDIYDGHLSRLQDWDALKPSATALVRKRMFETAMWVIAIAYSFTIIPSQRSGVVLPKPKTGMSDADRARALAELEALETGGEDGADDSESEE